ncbi:MAG TPA: DUF1592 domain-containing protein [Planctomycetota bacterium]|nr:DUF1592 domain-containing protein [Planctomycetota bacterium]
MSLLIVFALAQDFDPKPLRPFLEKHCAGCHMDGEAKGGLDLDRLSADLNDAETLRTWERVHDRLQAGEMPPKKREQPTARERDAVLGRLAPALVKADRATRSVVLRRLNRVEYENTVRDLFGVHVDLKDLLPEDATSHGFDTIGEALSSSSELVQAYLQAADVAIDAALGPAKEPKRIRHKAPLANDVKDQIGKLFRMTPDGVALFNQAFCPSAVRSAGIREPGTYRVRIHARGFQSDRPVTMQVQYGDVIAGRRPRHILGYWDLPPDRMSVVEFDVRLEPYDSIHPRPFGTRGPGKDKSESKSPALVIGDVEIEGPLEPWPPPSRRALLGDGEDARAVLSRVVPRAFRRPAADIAPYLALVERAQAQGRPYLEALRLGLKAVLCSPSFLFLDETHAALASRLSYFLWSTMPDEALLKADLSTPAVLRFEVERLLKDPRAERFVKNFTGQWLDLRDIDFTEPDPSLYPEFDALLKHSMVRETELYVAEILNGDRSLLEFVHSDWTMLNERLARHYGIEGVEGQAFRRVSLPKDSVRGGVLTQASVLKVTANGTNTSPVMRGVWVLDNILGRPVPPPPAGVPAVEPDIRGTTTLREQLDKHRNVPSCAGCHDKIDPPGFALESFDVIGGAREWYRSLGAGKPVPKFADEAANVRVRYKQGPPVDAAGRMPDGRTFKDIREFKALLLDDKDAIARGVASKLLTYGLGRGTGFSDRAEIDRIVASIKPSYGFRSLVHAVVQSGLFRRP